MMKTGISIVLVLLFSSCLNDAERAGTLESGAYDFRAYNADGSIQAEGAITLQVDADGKVSGSWEIEGMNGDGKLEGTLKGNVLTLNFHPGWADHNFILQGTVDGSVITGAWQWIGFPGVMSEGTFKAERS